MQTYEESLMARSGCDDESVPCANCGHLDIEHEPDSLFCRECVCRRFEPVKIEDLLADEFPEGI